MLLQAPAGLVLRKQPAPATALRVASRSLSRLFNLFQTFGKKCCWSSETYGARFLKRRQFFAVLCHCPLLRAYSAPRPRNWFRLGEGGEGGEGCILPLKGRLPLRADAGHKCFWRTPPASVDEQESTLTHDIEKSFCQNSNFNILFFRSGSGGTRYGNLWTI